MPTPAAFTLFDLVIGAHEALGTITFGASSSGATTRLNDQTESSATADDQFNSGTIFFIESTNLEIQNQFRRINDYDASSGEFRFTTALSSAPLAGTKYAIATPEFNFFLMERLANAALRSLGPLTVIDRSIVTSANQHVYSLSTIIKYSNVLQVDISGRTGSTTANPEWHSVNEVEVQPSTAGAANLLIFKDQPPSGRDVRIIYEGHHPYLTDSTQFVEGTIHPELAILTLIEKMYGYRNSRSRGATDFDVQRWTDAKRQLADARIRWPIWTISRKPQLMIVGDEGLSRRGPQPPPYGTIG